MHTTTIAEQKLKIQQLVALALANSGKKKPKEESYYETNFNEFAIDRFNWETQGAITTPSKIIKLEPKQPSPISKLYQDSRFTWNEKQREAITLALSGKEFCLIGAAGTGKSTTEKGIITALLQAGMVPPIKYPTKRLKSGQPSVAVVSFTRRAVQASKRNLTNDIPCLTIHKLLEFEPVFYEVLDPETQKMKKTMRFEPMRDDRNPIVDLKYVFIDESSMCDVDLFQKLKKACPNAKFIFVGDIQQLPPVYGSAILGFKMLELPVIELTEVYRQAMESPIIKLAHRILSGKELPPEEYKDYEKGTELKFHLIKKRVSADDYIPHAKRFFEALCKSGKFNSETDVVLCPYNEAVGTLELNRQFAQTLGEMRNSVVYEVIAGFKTHYLAVGDRVLVDKQDGIIKEIIPNALYGGKKPHPPSPYLNRWGHLNLPKGVEDIEMEDRKMSEEEIERMLNLASSDDSEERKNQSSHVIKVAPIVNGEELGESAGIAESERFTWQLKTAGELNNLLFSYALTVHKSQGSEWERVYFLMHHSHNTMCSREMLYTAVTRAKKYLYIICENRSQPSKDDSTFQLGIRNQRIKGNTLAEKAEYFKGKLEGNDLLAEKL